MTEPRRVGALEIEEDLAQERRSWIFERAGWVVLGTIVLLSLLGLFGKGVLSKASATAADGRVEAEYQRFARYQGPLQLRIRVEPEGLSSPEARIWLNGEYLRGIRIEQIEPEPESQQATQGGVLYTFPAASGEKSVEVTFYAVAEAMGRHVARIGPSPDKTASFWQFVYP